MKWAQIDVFDKGPATNRIETWRESGSRTHRNITRASALRLARIFAEHGGMVKNWKDGWSWHFEGDGEDR